MLDRPHPQYGELQRALQRCLPLAEGWSGIVYRLATPRYASRTDLLSGAGSKRSGGRWNPRDSFATVYASLGRNTAVDEALAHNRYYGIPEHKALPRVLVAIEVELEKVLGLTSGAVRRLLKVSRKRMVDEPWREEQDQGREALTQAIGRVAFEAGLEGILVAAAAGSGGVGLVVFPGNLAGSSRLEIVNASGLPK